jgi:hypothetical protein
MFYRLVSRVTPMSRNIPESDWKVFREVRAAALERFCQRVLDDIERIMSDRAGGFHDRYLEIFKLIERRDDELAHAFNDVRRSTAIFQLAVICSLGLLTPDEMLRFTPGTREAIESLSSLSRNAGTDKHV